jgi:predicted PolB exonuclease-like 3'-5' exonuclease
LYQYGDSMDYFYIDIETCPTDKDSYQSAETEEARKKFLNPIDSKIIAIGLKQSNKDISIFFDSDEKKMLEDFWAELVTLRMGDPSNKIVGFNIKGFDLPFLVCRSFINGVEIAPFLLKDIFDIKENIHAFRYGNNRGKLKELAQMAGLEIYDDMGGAMVPEKYWPNDYETIKKYLQKDIEITEALHQRCVDLKINEIARW